MWAAMRALACERRQAMEYGTETVLGLVKSRLNRLKSDTGLDEYLLTMIEAAKGELARTGITLRAESADDTMLLVDLAVWRYQNRDSANAMPPWLAQMRRERWLTERAGQENDS